MIRLKAFRDKAAGLPDLLNYAAVVDNGIVLGKNGCLMAGWFYKGDDLTSSTPLERNSVCARINNAMARLGSGWMSHHDAIRVHAMNYPASQESAFPDAVTNLIDSERRRQFEAEGAHYESVYALVLSYMPPLAKQSRLTEMMFEEDGKRPSGKISTNKILEQFKAHLTEIENNLSNILTLQRMGAVAYNDEYGLEHVSEKLMQYLHFCISGNNHPINLPPCPMYLDSIIGGHEFFGGVTPKIDDKLIMVVAIDGFPQESYPGILAALDQLPVCYRWNTRFIYMDPIESIGHIKKYRRKWQQKVRGFWDQVFKTSKGVINQDAQEMVGDTDTAIAEASSSVVAYGYYTSVIVLMDADREKLESHARYVRGVIQNLGFNARIETINTIEAWLGSLPGHSAQNVRRPMIHTLNLTDMLPLSSIWPGYDQNPCPYYPPKSPPLLHAATEGCTPFRLNLHVGDLGHTLIFGPTGAGKSTLLALMAAQFRRYPGATIYAFDKGKSLMPLTLGAGGRHYDIGGESQDLHFCPLSMVKTDQEQAWAEEWLAAMVELQGLQVLPKQRKAIHNAMTLLRDSSSVTLTDFVTNLQDAELREALEHYTISGSMGILDSENDSLELSSFQTFEIGELMNLGDKKAIPMLLYLFHRIEKSLKGQPALLLLDEAWLMLSHPVFREKIREWLKVLRKSNCAVVLATQSLSDAARSGLVDVLNESCPTKILLPNYEAQHEDSRRLYEAIGLNDRQIEIIANAIPKRQYYYLSPAGRRLFELSIGPIAMSFTGVSTKEDLKMTADLHAEHGHDWVYKWMDMRGVEYAPHFN